MVSMPQRAGERGHRFLDVDDRLAGAHRLAGQVDEHQPGLLAVGQAEPDELAGGGVDGGAGLDAQHRAALLAVPLADAVAGVVVGDAALALHRVQEVDALGALGLDQRRRRHQLLLLAGQGEVFR